MFYKSKIIYLLFFLLTNTYILTTDNSLIVLLDNREEGWQIMSEDFASALNDEACPILVSAHIINHLKKNRLKATQSGP